jgi:hypothetical protein
MLDKKISDFVFLSDEPNTTVVVKLPQHHCRRKTATPDVGWWTREQSYRSGAPGK